MVRGAKTWLGDAWQLAALTGANHVPVDSKAAALRETVGCGLRYPHSVGSWAKGNLEELSGRRALLEVCGGYLLILAVLWAPRPWQRFLYWLPVIWIALASWLSFESAAAFGLRVVNIFRSLWIAAVAAVLSVVTVVVAAHLHTLRAPPSVASFTKSYIGYAIWAFVQQFLMMDFFLLRLLRVLPRPAYAVLATTGIFTLAHLPNPVLTPLTMLWGLVGCWHFLKYRNLYPLALAHAILGITIAVAVPGYVTNNMRVGLGYLTYRQRGFHHRNHTDHMASTHAWVMAETATRRC